MFIQSVSDALYEAIKNTTIAEWLIALTALLYVVFAAYNNIWCWLFGILSSGLSIYLCFNGHLYLESALQLFYVLIGIYGWYEWKFGSESNDELEITRINLRVFVYLMVIGVACWIPLGLFSAHFSTQVLPYLDAFITSFSIVATWMTAKKQLENWLFWIVIDGLAIYLYASRGFYLIALIYFLYTILAYVGYRSWKKEINSSASH